MSSSEHVNIPVAQGRYPAARRNGRTAVNHQSFGIKAYFSDPTAGLRDNKVHAAVIRPPLGLPGLVSVELATERLVASLPEDHPLAKRESLSVAEVLPEPIIAAPASPGPWRDYWTHGLPVSAAAGRREAGTLDLEMHLVARRGHQHHLRGGRHLVPTPRGDVRADR